MTDSTIAMLAEILRRLEEQGETIRRVDATLDSLRRYVAEEPGDDLGIESDPDRCPYTGETYGDLA